MSAPWSDSFFDERYADLCLARIDDATTRASVEFIVRELGLSAGDTVLDQCCGTGRLSVALGRRGMKVIGVDISETYVRRAEDAAHGLGNVRHVAADAMSFRPAGPIDAVINWFTSFGYRTGSDFDRALFESAFASLRSGGRVAVDYMNVVPILARLTRPKLLEGARRLGRLVLGGRGGGYPHDDPRSDVTIRRVRVDFAKGVLETTWTIGGEERTSRLRTYMPHEIVELLEEVSFVDARVFGSARGEPFTASSPRCIVVARRP